MEKIRTCNPPQIRMNNFQVQLKMKKIKNSTIFYMSSTNFFQTFIKDMPYPACHIQFVPVQMPTIQISNPGDLGQKMDILKFNMIILGACSAEQAITQRLQTMYLKSPENTSEIERKIFELDKSFMSCKQELEHITSMFTTLLDKTRIKSYKKHAIKTLEGVARRRRQRDIHRQNELDREFQARRPRLI